MSITSISAIGSAYNFANSPYTPPPTSTQSITQFANGATVTTIRGSTGDVVAVTTAVVAAQNAAALQSNAQDQSSTFYVTA